MMLTGTGLGLGNVSIKGPGRGCGGTRGICWMTMGCFGGGGGGATNRMVLVLGIGISGFIRVGSLMTVGPG